MNNVIDKRKVILRIGLIELFESKMNFFLFKRKALNEF